jgi:hypothetical protein
MKFWHPPLSNQMSARDDLAGRSLAEDLGQTNDGQQMAFY